MSPLSGTRGKGPLVLRIDALVVRSTPTFGRLRAHPPFACLMVRTDRPNLAVRFRAAYVNTALDGPFSIWSVTSRTIVALLPMRLRALNISEDLYTFEVDPIQFG